MPNLTKKKYKNIMEAIADSIPKPSKIEVPRTGITSYMCFFSATVIKTVDPLNTAQHAFVDYIFKEEGPEIHKAFPETKKVKQKTQANLLNNASWATMNIHNDSSCSINAESVANTAADETSLLIDPHDSDTDSNSSFLESNLLSPHSSDSSTSIDAPKRYEVSAISFLYALQYFCKEMKGNVSIPLWVSNITNVIDRSDINFSIKSVDLCNQYIDTLAKKLNVKGVSNIVDTGSNADLSQAPVLAIPAKTTPEQPTIQSLSFAGAGSLGNL